jgi:AraC-like DNA-binding protein
MRMIAMILQKHEDKISLPQAPYDGDQEMLKMIHYIEENFREVTLTEVADHFGLSQGYCSRYIHKHTGNSFRQIVMDIKISKARDMLESSDLKINDIAYQCGFENAEHFFRQFKKAVHMTPGQYRSMARSQN